MAHVLSALAICLIACGGQTADSTIESAQCDHELNCHKYVLNNEPQFHCAKIYETPKNGLVCADDCSLLKAKPTTFMCHDSQTYRSCVSAILNTTCDLDVINITSISDCTTCQ